MKSKAVSAVVLAMLVFCTGYAAWAGVDEDVKALAMKGADHVEKVGKDKGSADLMNPDGGFRKGHLFLTMSDYTGVLLANPAFPALVGHNHWDLKDPNGKYFIREAITIAKTKGSGWLEYTFTDPDTMKIGQRKAWIQAIKGMDAFIMAPVADK